MKETNYLKDNVQNIKKLFAIPALKKFETKALGRLLTLSKVRSYDDGEVIIKEGDKDRWLYFLLSGKIRISREGVEITTTDRHGEMFGEMAFLDSQSRSATITALGPTTCLAVNTEVTQRMPNTGEAGNFLLLLYRVIAEYVSMRLRLTNEELIRTKQKLTAIKELADDID